MNAAHEIIYKLGVNNVFAEVSRNWTQKEKLGYISSLLTEMPFDTVLFHFLPNYRSMQNAFKGYQTTGGGGLCFHKKFKLKHDPAQLLYQKFRILYKYFNNFVNDFNERIDQMTERARY